MSEIPPWAYIGSGLLISIVSAISYQRFVFFFWVGCIFVLVGAVKFLIKKTKKPEDIEQKRRIAYERASKLHHQGMQAQHQVQQYKKCRFCGSVMRIRDGYCPRCGSSQIIS